MLHVIVYSKTPHNKQNNIQIHLILTANCFLSIFQQIFQLPKIKLIYNIILKIKMSNSLKVKLFGKYPR